MPRGTQFMRKHRKSGKNEISNVRVVDQNAGSDGAYIDRCISDLQNSHSQITVLCQDTYTLNSPTTAGTGILAGPQIFNFDEFQSFAAQFETFRIRAIRFDIYDVNPSNTAVAWFSTFHDQFTAGNQATFTQANVIDGPDSQTVPPGTGKITLYWRAHGTLENEFVTDDDSAVTTPTQFFGGLRFASTAGTAALKYSIVIKALVDFRGRL